MISLGFFVYVCVLQAHVSAWFLILLTELLAWTC